MMHKHPNLDNVPLQELVANNIEEVDVNYIKKFRNNAYGNNYNSSNPRPPFAQNIYGSRPPYVPNTTYASGNNVSNDLESTIRSFIDTQKELNKEFIAKFYVRRYIILLRSLLLLKSLSSPKCLMKRL
jgi:hypothetical protein